MRTGCSNADLRSCRLQLASGNVLRAWGLAGRVLIILLFVTPSIAFAQYAFDPSLWLEPDTSYDQTAPGVVANSQGNPCIVWMSWKAEVRYAKSTDGGETFLPSVFVDSTNDPRDRPNVALDSFDNPHVTWTEQGINGRYMWTHQVKYTKSTDGGQTFLPSIYIEPDTTKDKQPLAIAVDKDNNPMICWVDNCAGNTDVYFQRSQDGGITFEPALLVDPHPGYQFDPDMALDRDDNIYISYSGDWPVSRYVFMVKSTDGGQTFSQRVWVDKDSSFSEGSSTAVPPPSSQPNAGEANVMVAWCQAGVRFSKSTDGGETFGEVVTVAEGSECGWPKLAVNGLGNPIVVWDQPGGLHFSSSTDGGSTFVPRLPVDSVENSAQGSPNIVLGTSGNPFVVWADIRPPFSPMIQVFFAKGRKVGSEESNSSNNRTLAFALGRNIPNPFGDVTTISYAVPARSAVSLRIYDCSGRLIRTLVDEQRPPGRYTATWDGRDISGQPMPAGVYFCMLSAGNKTATEKMVLLR